MSDASQRRRPDLHAILGMDADRAEEAGLTAEAAPTVALDRPVVRCISRR